MARQRRGSGFIGSAIEVVDGVQEWREWINACLLPIAKLVGWVGLACLFTCAILWSIPGESWPAALSDLDPSRLPLYTMLSVIAASLLGWGCMQEGLGSLRERLGQRIGGALFVILPIVCGVTAFLTGEGWLSLSGVENRKELELFIHWYPPLLIVLALVVFVLGRADEEEEGRLTRGLTWLVPVVPYTLLLLTLVFGVDSFPELTDSFRDTLRDVGSAAIVIQVALAFVLCGGAR